MEWRRRRALISADIVRWQWMAGFMRPSEETQKEKKNTFLEPARAMFSLWWLFGHCWFLSGVTLLAFHRRKWAYLVGQKQGILAEPVWHQRSARLNRPQSFCFLWHFIFMRLLLKGGKKDRQKERKKKTLREFNRPVVILRGFTWIPLTFDSLYWLWKVYKILFHVSKTLPMGLWVRIWKSPKTKHGLLCCQNWSSAHNDDSFIFSPRILFFQRYATVSYLKNT